MTIADEQAPPPQPQPRSENDGQEGSEVITRTNTKERKTFNPMFLLDSSMYAREAVMKGPKPIKQLQLEVEGPAPSIEDQRPIVTVEHMHNQQFLRIRTILDPKDCVHFEVEIDGTDIRELHKIDNRPYIMLNLPELWKRFSEFHGEDLHRMHVTISILKKGLPGMLGRKVAHETIELIRGEPVELCSVERIRQQLELLQETSYADTCVNINGLLVPFHNYYNQDNKRILIVYDDSAKVAVASALTRDQLGHADPANATIRIEHHEDIAQTVEMTDEDVLVIEVEKIRDALSHRMTQVPDIISLHVVLPNFESGVPSQHTIDLVYNSLFEHHDDQDLGDIVYDPQYRPINKRQGDLLVPEPMHGTVSVVTNEPIHQLSLVNTRSEHSFVNFDYNSDPAMDFLYLLALTRTPIEDLVRANAFLHTEHRVIPVTYLLTSQYVRKLEEIAKELTTALIDALRTEKNIEQEVIPESWARPLCDLKILRELDDGTFENLLVEAEEPEPEAEEDTEEEPTQPVAEPAEEPDEVDDTNSQPEEPAEPPATSQPLSVEEQWDLILQYIERPDTKLVAAPGLANIEGVERDQVESFINRLIREGIIDPNREEYGYRVIREKADELAAQRKRREYEALRNVFEWLAEPGRENITAEELEQQLGIAHQDVQPLLDQLAKRGFIGLAQHAGPTTFYPVNRDAVQRALSGEDESETATSSPRVDAGAATPSTEEPSSARRRARAERRQRREERIKRRSERND